MAKSEVTREEAEALIDRIRDELGILKGETSSCFKLQGPANKHRVYVFKSKHLGRIDCTIALPADDPAFKDAVSDNGSISCHVVPTLEQLERVLRMLGDATLGTQVPNKPRPFAATKAPPPRRPKPVVAPVKVDEDGPVGDDGRTQAQRLKEISDRARLRRAERLAEEHGISEADAMAVARKEVSLEDVLAARRAAREAEVEAIKAEAGIEVDQ